VAAVPLPGKVRAASVSRLLSHAIFAGAQEVEIEHNGAVYRLRQTALGKLILTK
jgi:hemin uptake protein HemP